MNNREEFSEAQTKALYDFIAAPERQLDALKDYLQELETRKQEHAIPPSYIAFEVLENIFGGLEAGYTNSDLLSVMPKEIPEGTLEVPTAIIGALLQGWRSYKNSENKDLDRSLGLLGEETRRPPISKLQKISREKRLVRQVILEIWNAKLDGLAMPLSKAFENVSLVPHETASYETIRKAWYSHREEFNAVLTQKGLPPIVG